VNKKRAQIVELTSSGSYAVFHLNQIQLKHNSLSSIVYLSRKLMKNARLWWSEVSLWYLIAWERKAGFGIGKKIARKTNNLPATALPAYLARLSFSREISAQSVVAEPVVPAWVVGNLYRSLGKQSK
jgi:hypothetical protein